MDFKGFLYVIAYIFVGICLVIYVAQSFNKSEYRNEYYYYAKNGLHIGRIHKNKGNPYFLAIGIKKDSLTSIIFPSPEWIRPDTIKHVKLDRNLQAFTIGTNGDVYQVEVMDYDSAKSEDNDD